MTETAKFPPDMPTVKVGDRIRVTISGRTGTIDRRCKNKRDGWMVRWDEPMFGATEGRVTTSNMEAI